MSPREKLLLRLAIILYALALAGSAVLLSLYGERIGLERGPGTWVRAGAMTVLAVLLFGSFIARRTSGPRALLMLVLLLIAGAGVYMYVALVMVPPAQEAAANARRGGKPVDPGPVGRRWAN